MGWIIRTKRTVELMPEKMQHRKHQEIAGHCQGCPDLDHCTCEAKVGASLNVAKSLTDKEMIAAFLRHRRRTRQLDAVASS
jgi:hypothetical protein